MRLAVRLLDARDDRSSFRSGDPDLDRFFQKYAGRNLFKFHVGITYVAVEQHVVLGFATVSAGQIEIEKLPVSTRRGLPRYPLPALRLGRLGVDERAQGRGVGKALMKTVFLLARKMAAELGCVGVVVDAKAGAEHFYRQFGFEPVELVQGALGDRPQPTTMFLELGAIPAG
jgi:GNAT superfamily N-acetyltransferase